MAGKAGDLKRLARDGLTVLNETDGIRNYHPLYGLTEEEQALFSKPQRLVDIRWDHIAPYLPATGSALDIGSQHGWFTFRLAEHGIYAIGIEKSAPAFQASQLLTLYNQSERAAFLRIKVNPDTVHALPAVDVVICMAIFHHWVRIQGLEAATTIMQALADRCRDRMFFESGQVGDTTTLDRDSIQFMGDSPRDWIEGFLLSLGFAKVTHLAELSRSADNSRARHLLLATR